MRVVLVAGARPTQQHLSSRIGDASKFACLDLDLDLGLGLSLSPTLVLVPVDVHTIHVRREIEARFYG